MAIFHPGEDGSGATVDRLHELRLDLLNQFRRKAWKRVQVRLEAGCGRMAPTSSDYPSVGHMELFDLAIWASPAIQVERRSEVMLSRQLRRGHSRSLAEPEATRQPFECLPVRPEPEVR